jgi:hypothetical protein
MDALTQRLGQGALRTCFSPIAWLPVSSSLAAALSYLRQDELPGTKTANPDGAGNTLLFRTTIFAVETN